MGKIKSKNIKERIKKTKGEVRRTENKKKIKNKKPNNERKKR